MTTARCSIEKLVFGGAGLGRLDDGQVVFVPGGLPGELLEIEFIRKQRDFREGRILQVLEPAATRISSCEEHHPACSPWQILDPSAEQHWKRQIALDTLQRQTHLLDESLQLTEAGPRFGYRNRLEFQFTLQRGRLSLALHEPGTQTLLPVQNCCLGLPELQQTAEELLLLLEDAGLRPTELGRLTLRASRQGEVLALLQLSSAAQPRLQSHQRHWPQVRFQFLSYSDRPPPVWIRTHPLEEQFGDASLQFGGLGFFQINPFCLDALLADLRPWLEGEQLLDFYGGVGTLSVPHAEQVSICTIVEENSDAVHFAQQNIRPWPHFQVQAMRAEQALSQLTSECTVVVNPPRAGLASKVRQHLLRVRPQKVIYLSCNVSTCARDLAQLQAEYQLSWQRAYNFFPATPHIELLTILERIR